MHRREFIKTATILGTGLAIGGLPKEANAFLPFLLRFFFSRVAMRSLSAASRRTILSTARNRAVKLRQFGGQHLSTAGRSIIIKPAKMLPTAPLVKAGVNLGGFSLLAPELFKLTVEFNVNTIWIIDDHKPDQFFIYCHNKSQETISD